MSPSQHPDFKPWLFIYSLIALVWITVLLAVGGFTTTIGAGMAFLDWPLSNGSLNPEGWMQDRDQFAEHSHRLAGAKMGLLSLILMAWVVYREKRKWLRVASITLVAAMIIQGLLGGLRVLLDEQNIAVENNAIAQTFAVFHAVGAQLILCLLVAIVVGLSPLWIRDKGGFSAACRRKTFCWGIATCVAILLTLWAGAAMRHIGAGLAIPYFPFSSSENHILPQFWNLGITFHFLHRVGAVIVTLCLLVFLSLLWKEKIKSRLIHAFIIISLGLLTFQIFLGATVIWTMRNEHATTMHMLNGAFTFAAVWLLTVLAGYSRSVHRDPVSSLESQNRPQLENLPT